jgi:ABC-type transporter Mla subunit MlaD
MDLFKLVGTIALKNADANAAIDQTTDKASGLADTFNVSGGMISKAGGGISRALKTVGGAVAAYMTVDAIKTFGLGCIQAAADANAASSQFSQVFSGVETQAAQSLEAIAQSSGINTTRLKRIIKLFTCMFLPCNFCIRKYQFFVQHIE